MYVNLLLILMWSLVVLFFFKQKTAYELRISDWSSDVCSSDLLVLGPAGTGKSLLALTFVTAAVARGEKAAMFVFDEEMGLLFNRALGLGIDMRAMADSGDLKIGRASCRERGCQYV